MHNSRQWNEGPFIRFNAKSISREYGITIDDLSDNQAYIVSSYDPGIERRKWNVENGVIYGLSLQDLNEIIEIFHLPLRKNFWRVPPSLRIRGSQKSLKFPMFMMVINMTPDSFYPGSRIAEEDLEQTLSLIKNEGGEVVDIGGQSTRPGSDPVSAEEEMRRIKRAVEAALNMRLIVSVDSFMPEVLRECLEMGIHIINDVSGLENMEIASLSRRYDVPLVLMHKKGDFKTMQRSPHYGNVINEIQSFFLSKLSQISEMGIEDNVILDPGIGFGKRVEDNIAIINNLSDFKLGHPLLIGLSRKSFIGAITGEKVEERGMSSLILNSIAISNGADIVRTHDLVENMKLMKIIRKLKEY